MKSLYGEARPSTAVPAVSLREVPDLALFGLSVGVEADSAVQALALFKRAVTRLEEVLPALGATLEPGDFDVAHEAGKLATPACTVHATVKLQLDPAAPFWERAQRVAAVDDVLRAAVQDGKRQKPSLEVRRALPVFVVKDPERARPVLVQRLLERAKSLASGQGAELSQLHFDRAVEQRPVGLAAVELSLSVDGTATVKLP